MTRVDFYVVDGAPSAHDLTLCRVIEKAWQHGHQIYVQCADAEQAHAFDSLLWRFRDTSFVPHGIEGEVSAATPVILGTAADTTTAHDVLVNLGAGVPETASRFARVIESAGSDDISRQAARERYRYYQERGFPLHTHKVGP